MNRLNSHQQIPITKNTLKSTIKLQQGYDIIFLCFDLIIFINKDASFKSSRHQGLLKALQEEPTLSKSGTQDCPCHHWSQKASLPSRHCRPARDKKVPKNHRTAHPTRPLPKKRYSSSHSVRKILQSLTLVSDKDQKTLDRVSRFSASALIALQEAVEASVISLLEDANLCTEHAKRKTLFPQDILLARRIRGDKL